MRDTAIVQHVSPGGAASIRIGNAVIHSAILASTVSPGDLEAGDLVLVHWVDSKPYVVAALTERQPVSAGNAISSSTTVVSYGETEEVGEHEHPEYVRRLEDDTITAQHTFAPNAEQAPFVLGSLAQGQLVAGFRADQLEVRYGSSEPSGSLFAGMLWVDTDTPETLNVRNADNDGWHAIGGPHSIIGSHHTHGASPWDLVGVDVLGALNYLTPSSNPGAAAAILMTDGAGQLIVQKLGVAGAPDTGYQAKIAGDMQVDGDLVFVGAQSIATDADALTLAPAADLILTPGSNLVKLSSGVAIQSDGYASQTTGVRVSYGGEGDFRYLFADELHAKSFITDLEQALAGGQIITKSVAVVASDFTLPAAGGTGSLVVEDLPGATGVAVFESGDFVGMRQFSRAAGSLTIAWAWGTVSGYTNLGDGTQRWTFTRHATTPGGASGTIEKGALCLDFGVSGNGYYEVNALDGAWAANSPYAQIVTWASHPETRTVRGRFGQLRGITSQDEFGLLAGSGVSNSDQYIRASSYRFEIHNIDVTVHDGTNTVIRLDRSTPYLSVGSTAPTGYLSHDGFWVGKASGVYKMFVGDQDGERLQWDGSSLSVYDGLGNLAFTAGSSGAWLSTLAISEGIGTFLFNYNNGLILFGPYSQITTTAWHSTRGQAATLSGALHRVQGRWLGTLAPLVEGATTNQIVNPIFENNVSDGWSYWGTGGGIARVTDPKWMGSASCRLTAASSGYGVLLSSNISVANGSTITAHMRTYRPTNCTTSLRLWDATNSVTRTVVYCTRIGDWEYVQSTWTNNTGGAVNVSVRIYNEQADGSSCVYVDGVQAELTAYATSFFHGGFGSGYAWSGTEHNSASVRSSTAITLDNYVGLLNSRSQLTFHTVFQVSYDADATWPYNSGYNYIWDAAYSSDQASARLALGYDAAGNRFGVVINGATRITSNQSFSAGDWIAVDVTLDFAADDYRLYVNGVLAGSSSASLSAPTTLNHWTLGASYVESQHSYAAIAEYAVFGEVLSAEEIASLYALQRPLIDAGSTQRPGLYMLDGNFRLASSTGSSRIDIDNDSIEVYSSGAVKAALGYYNSTWGIYAVQGQIAGWTLDGSKLYNSTNIGLDGTNKSIWINNSTFGNAGVQLEHNGGSPRAHIGNGTTEYFKYTGSAIEIVTGGGYLRFNNVGFQFGVNGGDIGLVWMDSFASNKDVGFVRVLQSTYDMEISTGGDYVSGWQDLFIRHRSSSGTTRTPMQFDATNKKISIYGSSGATLAVRNNGDGDWPVIYAQQVSNNRAVAHFDQDVGGQPCVRFDGTTVGTGGRTLQGYMLMNINGTDRYMPYYS